MKGINLVSGRTLNQIAFLIRQARPKPGINTTVRETADGTFVDAAIPAPVTTSVCQCTEEELFAIWKFGDPEDVIFVLEHFVTPIPDGYARRKACLKFCEVVSGLVTEGKLDADAISNSAKASLGSVTPDGCYAVEYYGYNYHWHGFSGPKYWHGSTDDFRIYRILCSH